MPSPPCPSDCDCGRHRRQTSEERFWSKVDKSGDCWLWTGHRLSGGYGQFMVKKGQRVVAHRFSYELASGPIPTGLQLDHRYTCPKNCVNPEHLRPATQKQNSENLFGPHGHNRSSGVRGVTWVKARDKWKAQVGHNGRLHFGGEFKELSDAEAAAVELRNRLFTHNDADR
jgi:hypothetical protein